MSCYYYKALISSINTLNKWLSVSLRSLTYFTNSLTRVLFQFYLVNLFGSPTTVLLGTFFKVFFPIVGVLAFPFYALLAVVVEDIEVSLPGFDAERDLYFD